MERALAVLKLATPRDKKLDSHVARTPTDSTTSTEASQDSVCSEKIVTPTSSPPSPIPLPVDQEPRRERRYSPMRAIHDIRGVLRRKSESPDGRPLDLDGEPISRNQQRKQAREQSREAHRQSADLREEADRTRQGEAERRAAESETEEQKTKYGDLPPNSYAGKRAVQKRINFQQLETSNVGDVVVFRARVQHIRKISQKLSFVELRQQTRTVQGVLQQDHNVSRHMIYWVQHLPVETIVTVKGIVQEPKAEQGQVIGTTIKSVEILVHEVFVEGRPTQPLPFTIPEAEVSEADADNLKRSRISDRARQANRILDLRSSAAHGIIRVQSTVSTMFREALLKQDFIEIHTPKLQGGASEGGASVFKLQYFGRPAALAQSPQLPKQMAISADFGRVFEIGAVFRAENSNTHRHLTEYTGLDLEMTIDEHYHEIIRVLDNVFRTIFEGVYRECRGEIETLKKHFPHEDLVWADETPIIRFSDGIKMLNESGWRNDQGEELPEDEDLGTRDEIQLGKLIKDKYHTDYYILDKFPIGARPFYAMPDPEDARFTNSFDIFCRGQEILSGGQRIHDANMLKENLERLHIDLSTMTDYLNGFEWGMPPHGGGGIGLERLLMLMLNLGDIRNASLFPRDPKSFPSKPKQWQLRHPEASTLHPAWKGRERTSGQTDFQPLEKLIANYGDASNTSWLEPRTEIWRAEDTGAAVGFVPQGDFAIIVGNPLCHPQQYQKTIGEFLRYIRQTRELKPLWVLCGSGTEEVLATKHNWRTFSVAAEQRVDPADNLAVNDPNLQRKIRRAEKEDISITDYAINKEIPSEVRTQVDERVQDWISNRKGKQVHLTEIRPWQDMEHRTYHLAHGKDGTLHALLVMAQLSIEHGWQVKYSLDFPNAPSGAIEALVMHALKKAGDSGAASITFGGGATSRFTPGHNLHGPRVRVLSKAYSAIAAELKLTKKTEFREKLGAREDPIYVCYPPRGLGPSGVRAILAFFGDEAT